MLLAIRYYLRKCFFRERQFTYDELWHYVKTTALAYKELSYVGDFYKTNKSGVITLVRKHKGQVVKYPSRECLIQAKLLLDRYTELKNQAAQIDYQDLIYVSDGLPAVDPTHYVVTLSQRNLEQIEFVLNRETRKLTELEIKYAGWRRRDSPTVAGQNIALVSSAFNQLNDGAMQSSYFSILRELFPFCIIKLSHYIGIENKIVAWDGERVGKVSNYGAMVTSRGVYVAIDTGGEIVTVEINKLDVLGPAYVRGLEKYIDLVNVNYSDVFRDCQYVTKGLARLVGEYKKL